MCTIQPDGTVTINETIHVRKSTSWFYKPVEGQPFIDYRKDQCYRDREKIEQHTIEAHLEQQWKAGEE